MCELLTTEAECTGWKVSREFQLKTPGGDLKIPNLVCTKGDVAFVLNVTIRYDTGPETLQQATAEKVAHYMPVKDLIGKVVGA